MNDSGKKLDSGARSFREVFGKLDDNLLITGAEFSELICVSPSAISKMVIRNQLPTPLIRKNKVTRWSVQQAREYLRGLVTNPIDRPHAGRRGSGRPRMNSTEGAV